MDITPEQFFQVVGQRFQELVAQKQDELTQKVINELKKNGYSDFKVEDGQIVLGEEDMKLEYGDPNLGIAPKGVLRQMLNKIQSEL